MHNIDQWRKFIKKLDGYFFLLKTYFHLLAIRCAAQIVEKASFLTDKVSDFESVNLGSIVQFKPKTKKTS